MQSSIRSRRRESGAPNYLASVSDLMSSLLFIFIITLVSAMMQAKSAQREAEAQTAVAKLAQQEADASRREAEAAKKLAVAARKEAETQRIELKNVKDRLASVEERLTGNDTARRGLLESIQDRLLADHGIRVTIDAARGVLRIPETAVTFAVGSANLDAKNAQRVQIIGQVLAEELTCFTSSSLKENGKACGKRNPNGNTLDAVFLEGHTDNQTFRGDASGSRNLTLSTARSSSVYQSLLTGNKTLAALRNDKDEVLFSLSGYGSERPVPGHFHAAPTDDTANRRIELRFILTEPRMTESERSLAKSAEALAEKPPVAEPAEPAETASKSDPAAADDVKPSEEPSPTQDSETDPEKASPAEGDSAAPEPKDVDPAASAQDPDPTDDDIDERKPSEAS